MRHLFLTFVLAMCLSASSRAQSVELVSTIGKEDTSASIVARRLQDFAKKHAGKWTFVPANSCGEIESKLSTAKSVVILTTSACWQSVVRYAETISAGAGIQLHVFRRAGQVFKGDVNRIGFLQMADVMRGRLAPALNQIVPDSASVFLVTASSLPAGLTDYLNKTGNEQFSAVGIVEDGRAKTLRDFQKATTFQIESVFKGQAPGVITSSKKDAGSVRLALLPPKSFRGPQPKEMPEETLTLFYEDSIPAATPWESPVRWEIFSGLPAPQPKPVSVPILVSKGIADSEVWLAFADAQLAAPIYALVNPCAYDHEQAYRSFIRSAIADSTEAGLVALWEHAELLKSRGTGASQSYKDLKNDLPQPDVAKIRGALSVPAPRGTKPATCDLPWRGFFQNDKLAYYQRGMGLLRSNLEKSGTLDLKSPEVAEASACLRRALDSGSQPSCREGTSGTWTTYYAPFIAAEFIASEVKRAQ